MVFVLALTQARCFLAFYHLDPTAPSLEPPLYVYVFKFFPPKGEADIYITVITLDDKTPEWCANVSASALSACLFLYHEGSF